MTDWTPCAKDAAGWKDATVPDDACSQYLRSVGFDPTPKQYDFITCPADDVGFGGARGGAKSQGVAGDWIWHDKQYGESANGMVFRRERVDLTEFIEETKKIFERVNSTITEPKAPKWKWHSLDKYFESPNGSRLKFVYLDKDSDADKYQSGNFTRIYVEERGTFARERPLNLVTATLRSGRGVPCQEKSTFNPGGVGHHHCKERYVLYGKIPKGYEIFNTAEGGTRCFIPSKLVDNPHLGEAYVRRLRAACAGNEALLNAWLDGDWSIVEGAFFENWRAEHVIEPFDIPDDWYRFRSFRWGSAKPFSVGWWAVAPDDFTWGGSEFESRRTIQKGALVRYREWYGAKPGQTDTGLKFQAELIAEGIAERTTKAEKISYTVATPSMFASAGGPSLSERMLRAGVGCIMGDDHSARDIGKSGGWDQLRSRFAGNEKGPAIFCFKTCIDSVRTIPALQHDRDHPEDIDDESEDQVAADWRFAVMSRPWSPVKIELPKPKQIIIGGNTTLTMNDLWKAHENRQTSRF